MWKIAGGIVLGFALVFALFVGGCAMLIGLGTTPVGSSAREESLKRQAQAEQRMRETQAKIDEYDRQEAAYRAEQERLRRESAPVSTHSTQ